MPPFNKVEHVPDFEASPVRRPHSYETSDLASMTATPRAKPTGGSYTKPPSDDRGHGTMPTEPMAKPTPTTYDKPAMPERGHGRPVDGNYGATPMAKPNPVPQAPNLRSPRLNRDSALTRVRNRLLPQRLK